MRIHRGLGVPFVVPLREWTAAQGRYGIPVYIIYRGSLNSWESTKFSGKSIRRTMLSHEFTEDEVNKLGKIISLFASEIIENGIRRQSGFGLLLLCNPCKAGTYYYSEKKPVAGDRRTIWISESNIHPGNHIIADLVQVLEGLKYQK